MPAALKILSLSALLLACSACSTSQTATVSSTTASPTINITPTLRHAPQIAQAQISTVGYFDNEGHYSREQQHDSAYLRKKLGQDSLGRNVVQDFYVWQQRPTNQPLRLKRCRRAHALGQCRCRRRRICVFRPHRPCFRACVQKKWREHQSTTPLPCRR